MRTTATPAATIDPKKVRRLASLEARVARRRFRSSIARNNVAKTCEQCHVRIEAVHAKVVRGELWEKAPNQVPACVDCHEPHKARRVYYTQGMADQNCMMCHAKKDLRSSGPNARSLFVDANDLEHSRHQKVACAQCHTGANPSLVRPCATVKPKVDCSTCHAEVAAIYQNSVHGKLAAKGSPDAPECTDCHGSHGVKGKAETESRTYPRNIPALCGSCHRTGNKAALRYKGEQTEILEHYQESIHGKGLMKSGLVVTATCADCHSPHGEQPAADTSSTVNRNHVAETCAKCHRGVYEAFATSVHAPGYNKHNKNPLPVCSDCHSAHTIGRTDRAMRTVQALSAQGVLDSVWGELGRHRQPKLHAEHAGPIAKYLVDHPDCTQAQMVAFIARELQIDREHGLRASEDDIPLLLHGVVSPGGRRPRKFLVRHAQLRRLPRRRELHRQQCGQSHEHRYADGRKRQPAGSAPDRY